MIENRRLFDLVAHALLILGVAFLAFPIYVAFIASTHDTEAFLSGVTPLLPGSHFLENYKTVLGEGVRTSGAPPVGLMLVNSTIMALVIAVGKIAVSILSAFAIVYFRFPLRALAFWIIFLTLMLPVEVRIVPTYKVAADLGLLNSYAGLTLPLIASATATFLFRQFFLTVPEELTEAALIDGATPWNFFTRILLPLSRTNMAALFVILFIYGWNQYLWPLLVTTGENRYTIVMGLQSLVTAADAVPQWNLVMAAAVLALLPPVAVVIAMQSLFVRGLIETER
jgi:sn-glycerol 3-phosphate transport system permease protein